MTYKQWIISENCWRHPRHGDVDEGDLISLSEIEYNALMSAYRVGGKEFVVVNNSLEVQDQNKYPQEWYDQQETNVDAVTNLNKTDWKVIRELERLYLSNTDLHAERQAWRNAVVSQTLPET